MKSAQKLARLFILGRFCLGRFCLGRFCLGASDFGAFVSTRDNAIWKYTCWLKPGGILQKRGTCDADTRLSGAYGYEYVAGGIRLLSFQSGRHNQVARLLQHHANHNRQLLEEFRIRHSRSGKRIPFSKSRVLGGK